MSNPQNRQGGQNFPVNEKLLAQLVEAQIQKAKNESKELEIRNKEVDNNAKYAQEWLKHQAEIVKNQPKEQRKNITRLAWIAGGFFIAFIILTVFCLYLNKEEFLLKLLQWFGYIITTLGGYYFGRKSVKHKSAENGNSEH